MDKKNNKPQIRFIGFTDPWEQRKFSEITYLSGEKNKNNYSYQSFSISNEKGFVPQNEQFENGGTMETADKRLYLIVQPNSFAYNPARINVGSIGYYNFKEKVIVSSLYEVFQTTKDIDDRCLWHWFKSNHFQRLIEHYQEGGVRLYFYYNKLYLCSILLPSFTEQQKIGKTIDKLDNLITLHQRKLDKLKIMKKSLLEKMFPKTGNTIPEIRFKNFTEPWEQRTFSDNIISIQTGTNKLGLTSNKGTPLLKMGNIQRGFFSLEKIEYLDKNENVENENIAYYGDFFFNTRNTLELVGKGATWTGENGKYAFNSNIARFVFKDIDTIFFNYLYNTENMIRQIHGRAMGTTSVAAIYPRTLNSLVYKLPSQENQKKVGLFFMQLDNLITLHQRQLEKLKNIKKSLLDKMFV
jgi:type I restriction enzyme S subunit